MIDRGEMKARAKRSMSNAAPGIYIAALIMFLLTIVVNVLSLRLNFPGLSLTELADVLYGGGDIERLYFSMLRSSTLGSILDLVLTYMLSIITIGFSYCCIVISRGGRAGVGMLFDPFAYFIKCFCLTFLTGLLISLWSLLLVIPGIIAAYRYRFAAYFLINDPDRGVMECIRMSGEVTRGYKGQLFVLDLSFIGWSLLTLIPFVSVFVMPYMETTNAHYFNELIRYTPEPPPPGGYTDSGRDPWER